jgi:hypothetical protein
MYEKNVHKLFRVSFRGVIRTLQSNINIYYSPQFCSPLLIMEDLPVYPAAGAGLVALGSDQRYGTPSKSTIISQTRPAFSSS